MATHTVSFPIKQKVKVKNKAVLADIALFLVAVIWGGGFIAAKVALTSVTPLYILVFRFWGSGLLMLCLFGKRMKGINRKTILGGIIIGTFMAVGLAVQTTALNYTTASKQAFIVASYTVFVPFLSWFLTKKRPALAAIVAGVLSLTGIGILSLTSHFSLQFGDALSLLFALLFGMQIVCIGIFSKGVDIFQLTIVQLIWAGVIALIGSLLFAEPPQAIGLEAIAGILYLVIPTTTIAFTVQNVAQRYTTDSHVSILLSLESIFGVLLSVILLNEAFTMRMAVGAVFIFGAVLLSKRDKAEKVPAS